MLNKLKHDAERQLGRSRKVVITVPAYFDEVRRKATQDAGYMAGLEVLDIINEPTAAAIAHGFLQGFLNRKGRPMKPQKLLVYDLGGGTFDVTVMEIRGTNFLPWPPTATCSWAARTGTSGWSTSWPKSSSASTTSTRAKTPNTAGRLWRECEDAKRTLSARMQGLRSIATTRARRCAWKSPAKSSKRSRTTCSTARNSPPGKRCKRPA